MRTFLVIIYTCLATTLCAWTAWPEKEEATSRNCTEHHLRECEHPECATGNRWIIYKDACGKCKIYMANHKEPENICGKCSHHMNSSYDYKQDEKYAYYTYTCTNCPHKCYVKMRL